MSEGERERSRRDSEPPSGVHERRGRVLVIEPDMSARGRWDAAGEVHQVEFVGGPNTLPRALRRPGTPRAVSMALRERLTLEARGTLARDLAGVAGLGGVRVIIDVRRCDLESAVGLVSAGFILCADDGAIRGTAPRAAVGRKTMMDELADGDARMRLVKTIGATHISDRHGLSAGEYRVLRGLMDIDSLSELAKGSPLAESTVRSHASRIRNKVGVDAIGDVVRAAVEVAFDATFVLGRLEL